jgi:hypothetical protein
MADHHREWQVFIENNEMVIKALKRGECDGILPAAQGFLDGFDAIILSHFIHPRNAVDLSERIHPTFYASAPGGVPNRGATGRTRVVENRTR